MTEVVFEDTCYPLAPGQSVLDRLLAAGHELPYSCKAGACQSCMMQADSPVPDKAQAGLKDSDKALGYFLPCICHPQAPLQVRRPARAQERHTCTVEEKSLLNAEVVRLRLHRPDGFDYRPGQYITLWQNDLLGRSYSLASMPEEPFLELHVRRQPGGRLSGWIHDALQTGQSIQISGPIGNCFYTEGKPEQPLLLIGTSTGLAPLYGIIRDALAKGHQGPVHVLHAARHADGLYYRAELAALANEYPQLHYVALALEGGDLSLDRRPLEEAALGVSAGFASWRAFLCGAPALVNALRKKLFLAGASLQNIHADAFLTSPERT